MHGSIIQIYDVFDVHLARFHEEIYYIKSTEEKEKKSNYQTEANCHSS